ncbi:MAG: cupin domain-containing protein [Candidatus Marinimicrobia bacterium]|jgi:mannose-6-phosphate isomerase-like protein (cupin superfamily)|nr:cupin domain-containing protein [Candidatus Neomarinimicrobiota bacterium]MDP6612091.1 cupin domain-containing protein [Candidatus Neomarinimicrobiota bacterium]|tara:strand:+ start:8676 stop:9041 length:366 start_codon:yes stop_codon:yes gene_type:complete
MAPHTINITEKFKLFSDQWSPKVIAEMNDYQFKLAKVQGEFVWHSHDDTDETFIVIDGELTIEFRDKTIHLKKGEMVVVPKGVEHKPKAESECQIMLIEPKGVVNTGDVDNELTSENNVCI